MDHMIKVIIRLWLAASSIIALLFGWVMLAHAEKPVPLVSSQPPASSLNIPELAPIPSLQQLQQSPKSSFKLSNAPSVSFNFPVLRTRGS